ncbi:hypothetical protein ACKKBG_A03470 [Auxenochlorella protothecoides x Auxenochlorella symbiontica]|uniref:Glutamate decarboxylase n=1 Tax=Auxenochlorella protothecoides TaxID=3075 RepID=A0A1D1ZRH0_AUXPR
MLTRDERSPTYGQEHVEGNVSDFIESTFASRYVAEPLPRYQLSEYGVPAHVCYQLIKDVRALDATPKLNLASFVTTWMEPEARDLMQDALDVNYVDTDEYPSSTEIQNRCVSILAKLYHAPSVAGEEGRGDPVGTATVGSSEAIMLGALALKKAWQTRRKAKGLDTSRPNLVMGRETHVCWEKFCRYFDVEERYVYAEEGRYCATAELLEPLIDENTIGVAAVLGTTFTGEFEDVQAIDAMVDRVNAKNGWGVKIHVDAASGGFIAPFIYPDLEWDFRLSNVASINVSGHKYGLVYPGVGWVLWRDADHLPPELVFMENYLGSTERSITLNFSKGASQIIGQYYQFLRLGFGGYRKIFLNLEVVRKRLRRAIQLTEHFEILSPEVGVPVVAFRLTTLTGSDGKPHHRMYDEFDLADRLRMRGWVLPAYTMCPNAENIKLMRITIREDMSVQMADQLIIDLKNAIRWLDTHFIFTAEMAERMQKKLSLERLDSSTFNSDDFTVVRPC